MCIHAATTVKMRENNNNTEATCRLNHKQLKSIFTKLKGKATTSESLTGKLVFTESNSFQLNSK